MGMRIIGLCIGLVLGLGCWSAHAEEALCATVKIEIQQELTMERQGFEASMRITNSLDTFSLENVSVKVLFTDANGNPVVATSNTSASNAAFYIRVDETRDLSGYTEGADGYVQGGVIAPKHIGEMRWLIIPTATAAGQLKDGKLYFVGAELRYSYGGKDEVVNVAPDSIVVKPQPALTLDYFLTQEVVGDNGFTPEIEPAEPYTLGVRINNTGYGFAKSVKIESAQPRIVENKQGLAVNFKILGSYIEDQPSSPTMLINFGDIEPTGITTGRWIMESNLAGKFISFTASFTHADDLGGQLTSLLQATNANFLVRDVLVDLPGRDSIRDFLAYNSQHDLYVFESETTGANTTLCNSCSKVAALSASVGNSGGSTSSFKHDAQAGLSFAQAVDPYSGTRVLSRVIRADGTLVNPQNAWLSKSRAADNIHFNYFVNIFDNNSSGNYTLYWGGDVIDIPQPPVIQYLPDRVTYEGGNVGFVVQASDPNNTVPTLSLDSFPTGAGFNLNQPNSGVFSWSPALGQAGNYYLTFSATDGELTSQRGVNIRVNPANDTDGDGMDDAWEMSHFGNLNHDGSADSDGDGRSDLDEFNENSDPNLAENRPVAPQILSPIFNADTLAGSELPLTPAIAVTNGTQPAEVGATAIVFELYADEALTQLIASTTKDAGETTTEWTIFADELEEGQSFEDNHLYYWRAKTVQVGEGQISSTWVKSQFFINTQNDAPSQPQISAPTDGAKTTAVSPILVINNSTDIDRDSLTYGFEIYNEGSLTIPVANVSGLVQGNNGATGWKVPKILEEDGHYQWRATATDIHGLSVASPWAHFVVDTQNNPPPSPSVVSPSAMEMVASLGADNSLVLTVAKVADPEGVSVNYYFELDKVNTFDSADLKTSAAINEANNQAAWTVTQLVDGEHYFWRVKTSDGQTESDWTTSEFTVSLVNNPPPAPVLQNPVGGVVVTSQSVLFEVNPVQDPEGEIVTYQLEVYVDAALTQLVYSASSLNGQWSVEGQLSDQSTYYWHVKAEDQSGNASAWSSAESFTIHLPQTNQTPQISFVAPTQDLTLDENGILIQWVDEDPDDNASITISAQNGLGQIQVMATKEEDPDGDWDSYRLMPGVLAPGRYYILLKIDDGEQSGQVKSCCLITVPEPGTGLKSFWQFNEGTGDTTVAADSVGALTFSTIKSNPAAAAPQWVAGRNVIGDYALSFDGIGSYVQLPVQTTLPLLGDTTLSFWVNTSTLGSSIPFNAPAVIGRLNNDNRDGITWGSVGSAGQFGFALGDVRVLSMKPIADGQWHQIDITRNATGGAEDGVVRIYVDGAIEAESRPSDSHYSPLINSILGFGVRNNFYTGTNYRINTSSLFFSGMLDDIKIFDRSLSQSEIVANYLQASGAASVPASVLSQDIAQGIYQAEAASIFKGQIMTDHPNYSGIGFVDYDQAIDSYVEWVVRSDMDKSVTLQFAYSNGGAVERPMTLSVNDVTIDSQIPFTRTPTWDLWAIQTSTVNLKQGVNIIRLTATNQYGGPNVDYLKVISN